MSDPTILFEALSTGSVSGFVRPRALAMAANQGVVFGVVVPQASATGLTSQGGSVTAHVVPIASAGGFGAFASTTAPSPQASATPGMLAPKVGIVSGGVWPQVAANGSTIQSGDVDGTPTPRAFAFAGVGLVFGTVQPRAYGYAPPLHQFGGFLMPNYPLVGAILGAPTVMLRDTVVLADAFDANAVLALLDMMTGSDAYHEVARALQALDDGVSLADLAQAIYTAHLADAFIGSIVTKNAAQLTVLLADAMSVADAPLSVSRVLAILADSFHATLTLNTGDDLYTAWVMTPETRAMRRYTNWPFNSYAVVNGQLWAASTTGVYVLGGDTDAGTAIQASVRTGLMNLGSARLKRIARAYIGATAAGVMLLRVQATTGTNQIIEQTYRMTPVQPGIPGEHRVEVGRGFRSVYWTFELANDADGADFEVHDWQVLPLALTGREY